MKVLTVEMAEKVSLQLQNWSKVIEISIVKVVRVGIGGEEVGLQFRG